MYTASSHAAMPSVLIEHEQTRENGVVAPMAALAISNEDGENDDGDATAAIDPASPASPASPPGLPCLPYPAVLTPALPP